jgi:hypothetical protein
VRFCEQPQVCVYSQPSVDSAQTPFFCFTQARSQVAEQTVTDDEMMLVDDCQMIEVIKEEEGSQMGQLTQASENEETVFYSTQDSQARHYFPTQIHRILRANQECGDTL